MTTPAIVGRDVAKLYRRFAHRNQFRTLKSALVSGSLISDLRPGETFTALDGVSFEVPRGATFGVIGENGSGKSTLLKLVAGITKPSRGNLSVEGRVSALIELGAGFHPEISGRENVIINGIMLGLTRREIEKRFDEIVAFAELEDFIDAPVKTYSSGMYMRLGFAVAIHVEPEVLLIDEVLAVGDEAFTRKCLDKISEFHRRGKTILFVTHSLGLVENLCDDVIWLRHGKIADRGNPKRVVDSYLTYVAGAEDTRLRKQQAVAEMPLPEGTRAVDLSTGDYQSGRWGTRDIQITAVRVLDAQGQERRVFAPGETISFVLSVQAAGPIDDFVFALGLFRADGVYIFGTNTDLEGFRPRRLEGTGEVRLLFEDLRLIEGTYLLDVAVHRRDGTPYDHHRGLHPFQVKSRIRDQGLYRPAHHWTFVGGIEVDAPAPRSELQLGEEPTD